MGAGHSHGSADSRVSRMIAASAILGVFFAVELTTALMINSLALLADATHMLTDLVALFMGLTAVLLALRQFRALGRFAGVAVVMPVADALLVTTADGPGSIVIRHVIIGVYLVITAALLLRLAAKQERQS